MKTNKCYRHIFTCVATLLLAVCSVSSATSSRWKNLTKISSSKSTKVTFHSESQYKRVCYLTVGKVLRPSQVNATLCTHINIGFARVQGSQLVPADADQVVFYKEVQRLKISNPDLKILISIGGSLSEAVATASNRTRFAESVLQFASNHSFDGADFDWEYPKPFEKALFAAFLKELRSRSRLVLSVAIAPLPAFVAVYDANAFNLYLDYVELMIYDLHVCAKSGKALQSHQENDCAFTHHHSQLFARQEDWDQSANMAAAMTFWEKQGIARRKLLAGMPAYGRSYKLKYVYEYGIGAPAVGAGYHIWMNYVEMCSILKAGGNYVFDEESQVPFGYQHTLWFGYNDPGSIEHKCRWLKERGYGGAMVWVLNSDDVDGVCDGKTKFPIHQAVFNQLAN